MSNTTPSMPMDINEIRALLPHRYPFLLIDRVVELEPGKRVRCYKSVSVNEPFFQGHFPNRPVMPGVLVLEELEFEKRAARKAIGGDESGGRGWTGAKKGRY